MEKKILVVDDSSTVRKMIKFSLQPKGYIVTQAEDGVEGLEILESDQFDLILLDINMPRMDGFEFLGKIKQNEKYASIPVVMLTTEGQLDKEKAYSMGAAFYFIKPFKPNELLNQIEKLLS